MDLLHILTSAWVRHTHMAADTLCMNLVFEAGTADGAIDGTATMIGIVAYIATRMHSLADITSVAMRWLVDIHLVVVLSVATGMRLQRMRVRDTEAADTGTVMVAVDCCE